MLIVRVSVNWEPVEDILIHNTGKNRKPNGIHEYEVMSANNPKKRLLKDTITHRRGSGHRKLVKKVLDALIKEGTPREVLDL